MKRILTVLISLILVFSLCGCGLPSLNLTEEEQKIIAEYSAGLLLKYDKNYRGALKKIDETEEEDEDSLKIMEEDFEEPVEVDAAIGEMDVPNPEFSEDLTAEDMTASSDETEYSNMSISEAIGLDGFSVTYVSCETHEIYPEEQADDMVFSMQAQNGMELLVLNFALTNESDQKRLCDVLNSGAIFRLLINGSERVNANKTILLNDLASYSEELEGYAMADTVLVFELAKGTSENIQSLDLVIKNGENSSTHQLR